MREDPMRRDGVPVYVLGDVDTTSSVYRMEMLSQRAAKFGAVISKAFAFGRGEAACHDDLTRVDAVVEALGLAIATQTDIWVPFWREDLGREKHLRTLGLTLQRHGRNLLLGFGFSTVEDGINEIDCALRNEVKAVFSLDDAAVAFAGIQTLGAEIEAALTQGSAESEPPASGVPEGPQA